jgi:hypothetical protein
MSSVRMCDKCGTVFSELVEDWETYLATAVGVDDDGRQVTRTESRDACPACSILPKARMAKVDQVLERAERAGILAPALGEGELDRPALKARTELEGQLGFDLPEPDPALDQLDLGDSPAGSAAGGQA